MYVYIFSKGEGGKKEEKKPLDAFFFFFPQTYEWNKSCEMREREREIRNLGYIYFLDSYYIYELSIIFRVTSCEKLCLLGRKEVGKGGKGGTWREDIY